MPQVLTVVAIALLGLALLACVRPTRRFDSLPGEAVVFVAVPHDTYAELDPEDLAELWPSLRGFELEPTSLTLRVGDEYSLRGLRVIAVDSTGTRIGQIADLEYVPASAIIQLTPRETLRALGVGETTLTLRPRRAPALESFAPLPEWRLTIHVDPALKR